MDDKHPHNWFAVPPGADRSIVQREQIRTWLKMTAADHDHVHFSTFGTSTEGRPLDAVFIGDSTAGEKLQDITRRRAELVNSILSSHTDALAATWNCPIVLITAGIHATELGGPQAIPELVHWLATSSDHDARNVRERVITIIIPTLNPDGMDLVKRWHDTTLNTEQEGSHPPLLYHRFAGHDNNRDWLFRNLVENKALLDNIHRVWLPHVTLDQHQMGTFGPRFVLPPYADPWDPNVHPSTIAASSSLGQAIAADLTLQGKSGVMTGRYFDAWEPSRAIQHYRGGVRILAEAASANVACPVEIAPTQLAKPPLPMEHHSTTYVPSPWPAGVWRLRDIMDYHLAAATSLLRFVSRSVESWPTVQAESFESQTRKSLVFHIPFDPGHGDPDANRRLANMLHDAGVRQSGMPDDSGVTISLDQPLASLVQSSLLPTPFPDAHGTESYDLTTHHLPLMMGATINAGTTGQEGDQANPPNSGTHRGRYALINPRRHLAPNAIERALQAGKGVWRTSKRQLMGDLLIEPGAWLIDDTDRTLATSDSVSSTFRLESVPSSSHPISRRSVMLLNTTDVPTADHGWTRWWLQARDIPFLEQHFRHHCINPVAPEAMTYIIAHTAREHLSDKAVQSALQLVEAGSSVVAFGATGRVLAAAATQSISTVETSDLSAMHAPGALLRLVLNRSTCMGMGLDRSIPAMFQADGAFSVARDAEEITTLARYSARDTVVSGWMKGAEYIRNKPAVLEVKRGAGKLYAFSFRPLFRGQMLVTSPLVHNLLYSETESTTCPH